MNNFRNTRFEDIYARAAKYIGDYSKPGYVTKYLGDIELYAYGGKKIQIKRNNTGVWLAPGSEDEEIQLINDGSRCHKLSSYGLKVHTATLGDFFDVCYQRIVIDGKNTYDADSVTISKTEQVLIDFVNRIE